MLTVGTVSVRMQTAKQATTTKDSTSEPQETNTSIPFQPYCLVEAGLKDSLSFFSAQFRSLSGNPIKKRSKTFKICMWSVDFAISSSILNVQCMLASCTVATVCVLTALVFFTVLLILRAQENNKHTIHKYRNTNHIQTTLFLPLQTKQKIHEFRTNVL